MAGQKAQGSKARNIWAQVRPREYTARRKRENETNLAGKWSSATRDTRKNKWKSSINQIYFQFSLRLSISLGFQDADVLKPVRYLPRRIIVISVHWIRRFTCQSERLNTLLNFLLLSLFGCLENSGYEW